MVQDCTACLEHVRVSLVRHSQNRWLDTSVSLALDEFDYLQVLCLRGNACQQLEKFKESYNDYMGASKLIAPAYCSEEAFQAFSSAKAFAVTQVCLPL